jgi:hypothetical protein
VQVGANEDIDNVPKVVTSRSGPSSEATAAYWNGNEFIFLRDTGRPTPASLKVHSSDHFARRVDLNEMLKRGANGSGDATVEARQVQLAL